MPDYLSPIICAAPPLQCSHTIARTNFSTSDSQNATAHRTRTRCAVEG